MVLNTTEILSVLAQICDEKELRVTVKESAKGGLIAGATTLIGGMVAGPFGLAVGGAVGGMTAAYMAQGKFRSVGSIILYDLTAVQKESLTNSARIIIADFGPEDMAMVAAFALQPAVKERLVQEVFTFFESQLRMPIPH